MSVVWTAQPKQAGLGGDPDLEPLGEQRARTKVEIRTATHARADRARSPQEVGVDAHDVIRKIQAEATERASDRASLRYRSRWDAAITLRGSGQDDAPARCGKMTTSRLTARNSSGLLSAAERTGRAGEAAADE